MKFATAGPYANPEAAARKLIELANAVEAVQDGRIHIELLNGPMLFEHKATERSSAALLTCEWSLSGFSVRSPGGGHQGDRVQGLLLGVRWAFQRL